MCLAIPARVVSLGRHGGELARVDIAGVVRKVDLSLLDDGSSGAVVGDWVLIHVGFAISKIDEREARRTLRLLEGLDGELRRELDALEAGGAD